MKAYGQYSGRTVHKQTVYDLRKTQDRRRASSAGQRAEERAMKRRARREALNSTYQD